MGRRLTIGLLSIILLFILLISNVSAANYYVRAGASGNNNGQDWNNAWNSFNNINWNSINPGDTICIAGGTYTDALVIGSNGVSGNRIIIKRATSSDSQCGQGSIGWSNSYDSQVLISRTGIRFNGNGNYVSIDGVVDKGIRVKNYVEGIYAVDFTGTSRTNSVILENLDLDGPGLGVPYNGIGGRLINVAAYSGGVDGLIVRNCFIHGADTLISIVGASNSIFEYNKFFDSCNFGGSNHPNVMQVMNLNNFQFRYNEIHDWCSEGIMLCFTVGPCTNREVYVYGNVWHDAMSGGTGNTYTDRVLEAQYNSSEVFIYNNVFANIWGTIMTANGGSYTSNSISRNNIYWNIYRWHANGRSYLFISDRDYDLSDIAIDGESHNVVTSTSPFESISGKNYRLREDSPGINTGTSLSSQFSLDIDGNTRGQDGAWDIGAYEYGGIPPEQVCGNGIREGTEECDLGNGNGDCPSDCSSLCRENNCVIEIDGQCGDAEGEYMIGEVFPEGVLCLEGDVNPSNPELDDVVGATSLWQCLGSNDGQDVECEAERVAIQECYDSSTSWQGFSFSNQDKSFSFVFNATPSADGLDDVLGLSDARADSYSNLAVIIRFNESGSIDARDGSSYRADRVVNYLAGTLYSFRIEVDLTNKRYDVYVDDVLLAQDYLFRTEQAGVESLEFWNIVAESYSPRHVSYCNSGIIEDEPIPENPYDLNDDGIVDMEDVMKLVERWGQDNNEYDMNSDGTINLLDLMIIVRNWG